MSAATEVKRPLVHGFNQSYISNFSNQQAAANGIELVQKNPTPSKHLYNNTNRVPDKQILKSSTRSQHLLSEGLQPGNGLFLATPMKGGPRKVSNIDPKSDTVYNFDKSIYRKKKGIDLKNDSGLSIDSVQFNQNYNNVQGDISSESLLEPLNDKGKVEMSIFGVFSNKDQKKAENKNSNAVKELANTEGSLVSKATESFALNQNCDTNFNSDITRTNTREDYLGNDYRDMYADFSCPKQTTNVEIPIMRNLDLKDSRKPRLLGNRNVGNKTNIFPNKVSVPSTHYLNSDVDSGSSIEYEYKSFESYDSDKTFEKGNASDVTQSRSAARQGFYADSPSATRTINDVEYSNSDNSRQNFDIIDPENNYHEAENDDDRKGLSRQKSLKFKVIQNGNSPPVPNLPRIPTNKLDSANLKEAAQSEYYSKTRNVPNQENIQYNPLSQKNILPKIEQTDITSLKHKLSEKKELISIFNKDQIISNNKQRVDIQIINKFNEPNKSPKETNGRSRSYNYQAGNITPLKKNRHIYPNADETPIYFTKKSHLANTQSSRNDLNFLGKEESDDSMTTFKTSNSYNKFRIPGNFLDSTNGLETFRQAAKNTNDTTTQLAYLKFLMNLYDSIKQEMRNNSVYARVFEKGTHKNSKPQPKHEGSQNSTIALPERDSWMESSNENMENLSQTTNVGNVSYNSLNLLQKELLYWAEKIEGSNHPEIYYIIGTMYQNGNYIYPVNESKASSYYLLATKGHHSKAAFRIGELHEKRRQYSKSIQCYIKAASMGVPEACYKLALCYLYGNLNQKKNYRIGIIQLNRAASLGESDFPDANYLLGKLYLGEFEDKLLYESFFVDVNEGLRLIEKAASSGLAKALYKIGKFHIYGVYKYTINIRLGIDYYFSAAKAGCADAKYEISKFYVNGYKGIVNPNPEQSFLFCYEAAELDNAKAMCTLGEYYLKGFGTTKDTGKALVWLKKAQKLEYIRAKSVIKMCKLNV
ncbi:hypothetical protein BB560_001168 [Smittium megazygosporum]|uniref:Uncharacterized protein n=1 Tax=Smittium megazygosporum TaxID=133381 RepID=A0A2T9Z9Z9_9FUNG|nr:hypothetical protein BB560_004143 [Smittium megazygosporum]PVV04333.1 hypothetical protein BB560_001168 [Smittium megazygosporum]